MHVEGEYKSEIKIQEKACFLNRSKPCERMRKEKILPLCNILKWKTNKTVGLCTSSLFKVLMKSPHEGRRQK